MSNDLCTLVICLVNVSTTYSEQPLETQWYGAGNTSEMITIHLVMHKDWWQGSNSNVCFLLNKYYKNGIL